MFRFIHKKIFVKFVFSTILIVLFLLCFSNATHAASLSFLSASSDVSVGNILSVKVLVDTNGKVINSANGVIQFPSDLLDVLSISKSSSIFSLWVEDPKFSNSVGQITFNGGLPNPGYIGNNGEIISIVFKAKKQGVASILFLDVAVLANDGLGTDILSSKNSTSFNINGISTDVKTIISSQPEALIVKSTTHPNQTVWYSSSTAMLSWNSVSGMTAVQTLYGSFPDSIPNVYYAPPILNKKITKIADGTAYFHVRYQLGGVWSKTSHFALNIDTTAPNNLSASTTVDGDGQVVINLQADDSVSGIDHFTVGIDGGAPVLVPANNGKGVYQLSSSFFVGQKDIMVTAFDKAGNKKEVRLPIEISPMSAPIIKYFTDQINVGDTIKVNGITAYPEQQVLITIKFFIEKANNSIVVPKENDASVFVSELIKKNGSDIQVIDNLIVKSDKNGVFTFTSEPIKKDGLYDLSAQVIGDNGENGVQSKQVQISVNSGILATYLRKIYDWLLLSLPFIGVIIVLIILLIHGWGKVVLAKRKNKDELYEFEKRVHNSYIGLIDEAEKQIKSLQNSSKNRSLTEKEIDIIRDFERIIKDTDLLITKKSKNNFKK